MTTPNDAPAPGQITTYEAYMDFDQYLNDTHPTTVAGYTVRASTALYHGDAVAYTQEFDRWCDRVGLDPDELHGPLWRHQAISHRLNAFNDIQGATPQ